MKIPTQLVELGLALELDCSTWEYSWNLNDRMKLFSNVAGDKLILLYMGALGKRVKHPKKAKNQNFSKARALYSKFQGFKSDDIKAFSFSEPKLTRIGTGNFICYRSNKWNKPKVDYKHDFKSKPAVWVDNTYPHVIIISSKKLRVTARGIEG